jgi:hypothetical protein
MHPRLLDLDRSHSGKDASGWQVAVADHLPMTGLVAKVGMGIDPTRNLSFHSLDQKSLGTFPENPAQHVAAAFREWQDSCVNARIVHGGVLLCLVGTWVKRTLTPRVRRLFSFDHQQLSVISLPGLVVLLFGNLSYADRQRPPKRRPLSTVMQDRRGRRTFGQEK